MPILESCQKVPTDPFQSKIMCKNTFHVQILTATPLSWCPYRPEKPKYWNRRGKAGCWRSSWPRDPRFTAPTPALLQQLTELHLCSAVQCTTEVLRGSERAAVHVQVDRSGQAISPSENRKPCHLTPEGTEQNFESKSRSIY